MIATNDAPLYKPCASRVNSWLRDYPDAPRERVLEVVYGEEKKAAFHEAGHVGVIAAIGGRVEKVDIVAQEKRGGRTSFKWMRDADMMIHAMAGPIAERLSVLLEDERERDSEVSIGDVELWHSPVLDDYADECGISDSDKVIIERGLDTLALVYHWTAQQRYQWTGRFSWRTERAVKTLWPAIESIAHELLVNKEIPGATVHRIVDQFSDLKKAAIQGMWTGLRAR